MPRRRVDLGAEEEIFHAGDERLAHERRDSITSGVRRIRRETKPGDLPYASRLTGLEHLHQVESDPVERSGQIQTSLERDGSLDIDQRQDGDGDSHAAAAIPGVETTV